MVCNVELLPPQQTWCANTQPRTRGTTITKPPEVGVQLASRVCVCTRSTKDVQHEDVHDLRAACCVCDAVRSMRGGDGDAGEGCEDSSPAIGITNLLQVSPPRDGRSAI